MSLLLYESGDFLKRLKQWLPILLILIILMPAASFATEYNEAIGEFEVAETNKALFDAMLLMNVSTYAELYSQNAELIFSPTGGAVNLMVAYIITKEADLNQEIPVIDAVTELSSSARKLDLKPGDRWLVKDLLAGMLLYGAQDAAMVLSDHVSGSQDDFVAMMNMYAEQMGMMNTIYENPLGAYSSGQTTTVSDLMILSLAVLENADLKEIVAQSSYAPINGLTIENRMEVMQPARSGYDPRIKGMCEGSTSSAGTNTILYADADGKEYLFIGFTKADDRRSSQANAVTIIDLFWNSFSVFDATSIVDTMLSDLTLSDGSIVSLGIDNAPCKISVENSFISNAELNDPASYIISGVPILEELPEVGAQLGKASLIFADKTVATLNLIASNVQLLAPQAPPVEPAENVPVATDKEIEIPIYSAEDWAGASREKSFIEVYGCFLVIGAAIILAAIVLISTGTYRKRKH